MLSLIFLPTFYIIFLLYLLKSMPSSSHYYNYSASLISTKSSQVFYNNYLFLLVAPVLTLFLNIRFYKIFLTLFSVAFFVMISLQSYQVFQFILLYAIASSVLILSVRFAWPHKKMTFFISYFAITLGVSYYLNITRNPLNSSIGNVLLSFVAYDALIAWTWLYSQTESQEDRKKNDIYDLFLYLFLPFFFIRRLAISFTEFKAALNATTKSIESIYLGWATIFRTTFINLLFTMFSSQIIRYSDYALYDLLFALNNIYHYCGLSAGLILTLGLKIREPFDFFAISSHPIDFWKRWNIYMRDWLSYFYFYPSLKLFKRIELALIYTFFFSGVYHMLRFVIIGKEGHFSFFLKFFIPGIVVAIFCFFYIRLRHFFYDLPVWIRHSLSVFGIISFWTSFFYIRNLIVFISNYFYLLFYL